MKRFRRKPHKCPECGSTRIATILYGMQAFTDDLQEKLDQGNVVLGGCSFAKDGPTWQCTECNAVFYKKTGLFSGM
ncbi:MAG: hypothetical protein J7K90_00340 [Desulfuromusa sp.]|nr:hypothetical protein [Desulfuromusa sp.]